MATRGVYSVPASASVIVTPKLSSHAITSSTPSKPMKSRKDFRHGDPETGQMWAAFEMAVDIETFRLRV